MTTNVTPGYRAAEARFKAARTGDERLAALEEMASTLNKHKGTEKLFADIKRRIKEEKQQLDKKGPRKGFVVKVEREGAGQVALVGPPNAGKSSLLAALTNATPEIADYPFTTHAPTPGMMRFEDVRVQLVDLPPVSAEHTESWVHGLVRTADAVLLVFDLEALDPMGDIDGARALLLDAAKVPLLARGERPPEDPRLAAKPALLVGTRLDLPGAADSLGVLRELYPAFDVHGLGRGTDAAPLRRAIWDLLGLLRVYSKSPGKEADRSKPFTLPRGATLLDFAGRVHKDFTESLKFARVWGPGKFDGQRIQRDYLLAEGDIVELHT